jgi:hypothetical protein
MTEAGSNPRGEEYVMELRSVDEHRLLAAFRKLSPAARPLILAHVLAVVPKAKRRAIVIPFGPRGTRRNARRGHQGIDA